MNDYEDKEELELIQQGFDVWYDHHFGSHPHPDSEFEMQFKRHCEMSWRCGRINYYLNTPDMKLTYENLAISGSADL